ncbi:MAG: DUF2510 domain-containing protein [Mycobacteriaceae bacterium]|nr:DUF2510 domain-containing protein [Mycobacteriaceae bacterium]
MGAPGWYPNPDGSGGQRYFDGTNWGPIAPPDSARGGRNAAVAVGVCLLIAVGLVMSMQSASLMTGSTLVWTGVAVVAAGTAAAFILRGAMWVRIVSVIVLILALANAVYIETQLTERRNEMTRMFDR